MKGNGLAPAIVWFRQDLRLADNPALNAAVREGRPVLPLYIWAPEEEGDWPPGAASRWWLHQSLAQFDLSLRSCGSRLIFRKGPTLNTLRDLIRDTGATAIYWNRRYEPAIRERDANLKTALRDSGLTVSSFNSALLFEPNLIKNKSGRAFQVFTPFWKHCLQLPPPPTPEPAPNSISSPVSFPDSVPLTAFKLEPGIDWAGGLRASWEPGEGGAQKLFAHFQQQALLHYVTRRDHPSQQGTSRLSPHLHFGEISPRQIWHAIVSANPKNCRESRFLAELGWREFSHHLLYYFPDTPAKPLRPEFERMRWRKNDEWLHAWQRGRTGYPIVDAGMRELWTTGWMHNRVRMIVASFLVKDLLLSWQEGARWFWDTLVDADLAQNTLGWQWTSGCGADAAPFFRIFNPVLQGEKFDATGNYVRRWIPELAKLPDEWIHHPHEAPPLLLQSAGVGLGNGYPHPLVNHTIARNVALEEFERIARKK